MRRRQCGECERGSGNVGVGCFVVKFGSAGVWVWIHRRVGLVLLWKEEDDSFCSFSLFSFNVEREEIRGSEWIFFW